MELPGFDLHNVVSAQNPLAPVLSFHIAVRRVLAQLLGLRMCDRCPDCIAHGRGCASQFGSNSTAAGGVFGLCEALAGAVEAQQLGTMHFRCFAWRCDIYQHSTLNDIDVWAGCRSGDAC